MAQRTFSYKQYRAADLTIFAVLLIALETAIGLLAKQWQDTLYFVSLFYAIACLVMMRWGGWGAIHCVLAGIVRAATSGADIGQYVAYIVGNCFALLALLLRDLVGKKKVRDNAWLTLSYVLIVWVAVTLGRTIFLSIFKQTNFFDLFVMLLSTDILSIVVALVIIFICRRQKGLFEDQKEYLIRTEEERRAELQNPQ